MTGTATPLFAYGSTFHGLMDCPALIADLKTHLANTEKHMHAAAECSSQACMDVYWKLVGKELAEIAELRKEIGERCPAPNVN